MSGESAKLQSGCLILPKTAPWLDEFLLEYMAFPAQNMMTRWMRFLNS